MRAILEDVRTGAISTYEVPQPELRPGGILVRTAFSAISAGTERAKVEAAEKSLLGKAMARPDLVKQVLDFARVNGIKAAYDKVRSRLDTLSPLGYSCAGIVIGVGEGVEDLQCGDRVACGGGGYANHCEVNWVPTNLVVRVPEPVLLEAASLTTIGAIAMQGLRQAKLAFGETVMVIGAGLVGVLTIKLARAAGCRVVAVDLDEARVEKARSLGADLALLASDPGLPVAVANFSRYGADAAIITAATHSAEPLEMAAEILRDRGRIVVVGDVGMGVSRRNMYHKELTLAMSRSYGPGRYDPSYEEGGCDYPVGHVRWTEHRNMQAFLDFLASGAVDVTPLLETRYPVDDAAQAYAKLRTGEAYTSILEYPASAQLYKGNPASPPRSGVRVRPLRVGCIGAGSFACNYLFPNLKGKEGVSLESIATASGLSAESARRNFAFNRTQTPSELLQDPELNAVFIASRHQSHADYVVTALYEGKAVFVEKPLAVRRKQLELVRNAYEEVAARGEKVPFLMVGFNRRFAPATQQIRHYFENRQEPMLVHIRVNAGHIPANHWVQQENEGGRIIGEFCHFVDWSRYIVGAPIRSLSAAALPDGSRYSRDNVVVTLSFADGSIANILYLANGDPAVPKESFEVFCEGAVARLEDFELLQLVRNRKTRRFKSARDKGHREEVKRTLECMLSETTAPIPFEELIEVTEAVFSVADAIGNGQTVSFHHAPDSLALTGLQN